MVIVALDLDATLIDRSGKWMPGVEQYIPLIQHELGYGFIVITARGWTHMKPTPRNLQVEHILTNICKKLNITINGYVCTSGGSKGTYCSMYNASYIIDDQLEFITDCPIFGIKAIWFNTDSRLAIHPHKECKSWYEVYMYLKNECIRRRG